jgi:hypothetical protein
LDVFTPPELANPSSFYLNFSVARKEYRRSSASGWPDVTELDSLPHRLKQPPSTADARRWDKGGTDALTYNLDHAFSEIVAETEQRSSPRNIPVYRVVKLSRQGKEGLAHCRNISDGGMKLETSMPLSLMDNLCIEISPGREVSARVVWTNGDECGVAFDTDIDCQIELRNAARLKWSERARSPRLQSSITARLASEGVSAPTTITNISQQGMLVSHTGGFSPGLHVKVALPNGSEKQAVVRWTKDNFAGLYLYDSFDVMELGDLTALSRANDDA